MPAGDSAKQKFPEAEASGNLLEVTTRFELVDEGFADPCLTTWPRHHIGSDEYHSNGAADEARTRYLHLGKVALYQMSYGRIFGAFVPAPSRAILANIGVPAKICKAKFCGEEEKVWRSSRQSCLQDCTMNSRTFDEATRIGLEPTTPSVTGWCSNQLSYRAIPEQLLLLLNGAADEARTRYLHLGKVALYQMSYGRILGNPNGFPLLVPPIGIEPMTRGFSVPCSTD